MTPGRGGSRVLRRASGLLAVALVLAACATASRSDDPLDRTVRRHVAAIGARDMPEIVATITAGDHLLLILPSGRMTRGRSEYLAFHESLFAASAWTMTFDRIHLQRFGEYAHALYAVTFDDDGAGPAPATPAYLSLGFGQEDGEWRLVHDQNTSAR